MGNQETSVSASDLRPGDLVVCEAGDAIPSDGEIIEGIASVDESAITGESAPVIRESGGDRSAVTGGTRVLSDRIVIKVTCEPGHSFLDRMISLVEGSERQKTPNEKALGVLLVSLTLIFILVTFTLPAFTKFLGGQSSRIQQPGGAARVFDPHHHRRIGQRHRHFRHRPPHAPERARHFRPGGGSGGRCGCVVVG